MNRVEHPLLPSVKKSLLFVRDRGCSSRDSSPQYGAPQCLFPITRTFLAKQREFADIRITVKKVFACLCMIQRVLLETLGYNMVCLCACYLGRIISLRNTENSQTDALFVIKPAFSDLKHQEHDLSSPDKHVSARFLANHVGCMSSEIRCSIFLFSERRCGSFHVWLWIWLFQSVFDRII